MTLLQAMQRFRAGALGRDALLRTLAETPQVYAASYDDRGERRPDVQIIDGERRQPFYTSPARVPSLADLALDPAGELRSLDPAARRLELDPGWPEAVSFDLDVARRVVMEWGSIVHLERLLQGQEVWGAWGLVQGYRHWRVLLDDQGEPCRMADALLVFTAADALERWRRDHPGGLEVGLRTPDLLALLDASTPVCINPSGPVGPQRPSNLRQLLTTS